MNNKSYKDSAFLIKLRTHQSFRGRVKDMAEGRKILDAYEIVDTSFLDVHKNLMPKGSFDEINTVRRAARQLYYDLGHPWDDQGYRIISAAAYPILTQRFNELYTDRWIPAVERFLDRYEEVVEERVRESNGLIRFSEYPTRSELVFEMSWDILPLPVADDFRFQLPREQREAALKAVEQKVNEAHRALYGTLGNIIKKFSEFTNDPKKTIKPSSFEELQRLAHDAEAMNFMDDPMLKEVIDGLKSLAGGMDYERLYKDKEHRASLGDPFKELEADVEAKMAAFF